MVWDVGKTGGKHNDRDRESQRGRGQNHNGALFGGTVGGSIACGIARGDGGLGSPSTPNGLVGSDGFTLDRDNVARTGGDRRSTGGGGRSGMAVAGWFGFGVGGGGLGSIARRVVAAASGPGAILATAGQA